MKYVNIQPIIAQATSANINSSPIDASQWYSFSAQIIAGAGTTTGTVQLQVSNDPVPVGYNFNNFTPTNWSNLGSASSISAAGTSLVAVSNGPYRAIRAVFTDTFANISQIIAAADVGQFASTVIHIPATASAAQADYIVLSTTAGAKVALWLDIDAAGTVPTGAAYVAAGTKVKVSIIGAGSAADNSAILQTALNSVGGYTAVDNMDGTVTATQTLLGAVTAPARHNADDSGNGSMSFTSTVTGHSSSLPGAYILASSVTANYYFWFKVSGFGSDPAIAGRTGIEVDLTAGATASTIGGLIRTAAASKGWTVTGATTTAILTNSATGPTTIASDGAVPSGFTVSNTQPTGTITVSLMAICI